jgi:hypothetical protein
VLAIARGFIRNLLTTVFAGLAIAFGSFAIATASLREREKLRYLVTSLPPFV